eukprot:TRINITY_DN2248_c0_g1_i1.p1 TRINITY_DN2248_c0_g1~~TRINITY_DN2248_c0_g1_i1.p1  ORF type:complete len:317 (-),score=68.19 TRINITY_DN2248_c0_g1_i1:62-1012(-)
MANLMAQAQALASLLGGMQQAKPAFKGGGGSNNAMMEGDWNCASCGDHQFARNVACRKCGAPKSDGSTGAFPAATFKKAIPDAFGMGSKASSGSVEQGDWFCASCGDHQFARNIACRKCGAPKSGNGEDDSGAFGLQAFQQVASAFGGGGGGGAQAAMPGDWNCLACGDHQFARNQACRKCGAPKAGGGAAGAGGGKGGGIAAALAAMLAAASGGGGGGFGGYGPAKKGQMVEGDWLCPSCGDHQFARNKECRKCGAAKDDGAVLQQATSSRLKPGDWICPGCGDHQFMKNTQCRKCGVEKPPSAATATAERSGPY